jgi:plastocyanin
MSIRRIRSLAVLAATCLALTFAMSSFASAATFRVRGVSNNWRPRSISVAVGSRIVWRSVEGTHNVTATSNNWNKNSGPLPPGSRTSFTFNRRGTYRYRCTFHSTISNGACTGMCGKVIVG